jgi:hypothetical protein
MGKRFDSFVFVMGHLIGLSPNNWNTPSSPSGKSQFLHCFTFTLFYIADLNLIIVFVLHGHIKLYKCIYFCTKHTHIVNL